MENIATNLKTNIFVNFTEEDKYIDSRGVIQYEDERNYILTKIIDEYSNYTISAIEMRDKKTYAFIKYFSSSDDVIAWLKSLQQVSISDDGLQIYVKKKIDV